MKTVTLIALLVGLAACSWIHIPPQPVPTPPPPIEQPPSPPEQPPAPPENPPTQPPAPPVQPPEEPPVVTPPQDGPPALAPGAYVYVNDKPLGHGFDSTPRVHGDAAFCKLVGGEGIDCHLDGMKDKTVKVRWEISLMGGCPVWQYSLDGKTMTGTCHDDQVTAAISCDHFGSQNRQDDPQTHNVFEGKPEQCGLQTDEFGPAAGFFTVAHGKGYVRACAPNDTAFAHCGSWKYVDH